MKLMRIGAREGQKIPCVIDGYGKARLCNVISRYTMPVRKRRREAIRELP